MGGNGTCLMNPMEKNKNGRATSAVNPQSERPSGQNEARQPTPGDRLIMSRSSVARRGCADR